MAEQDLFPGLLSDGRVKSPFRYPGGKFYAFKYMSRFLAKIPHNEFREPFAGAAQVFFAKRKAEVNWLNDIFKELIDVYRVIQDSALRAKLLNRVLEEHVDKERHAWMKKWVPQNRIERAHRFYYLNRTSYSGIMHKPAWGYHPANSAPPKSWGRFITEAAKKLEGVKLTSLDFEQVIDAPPNGRRVFMYIDPPYIEADQRRAYSHHFELEDHQRLAKTLHRTKYKFLLSYDDCRMAKQLYSWARIHEQEWWYNTANITNGASRKMGKELLITNY